MKKFRVTTTDGFIFNGYRTRKEADAAASQQSRRLQETMLIKRWNNEDECYEEIARVTR